ncbi:uncharacterized protein LOC110014199 isoform X3 [Oryzias latipes]|uniref:uncharacterized protein LOC110014199 isoform X3 n=1 Tax=Oryzias latipes TaxID=8090 RepID=UPI000CE1D987|nr:uncharacterized protein LOC110014199 isoform X3 [Oryzias latipes]
MCPVLPHLQDHSYCRRPRWKRRRKQQDGSSGREDQPPERRPRPSAAAPEPDAPPPVLQEPEENVQPAAPQPPLLSDSAVQVIQESIMGWLTDSPYNSEMLHQSIKDPGLSLQQNRADQLESVCVQRSSVLAPLDSILYHHPPSSFTPSFSCSSSNGSKGK